MPFEDLLIPKQIDPATNLTTDRGGIESLFDPSIQRTPLEPGAFLTSKYDQDLKVFEDQAKQRASKQSSGEQFGAFVNQAVVGEIIGGTIEGIGYLADIGDAAKVITGEEVELGNAITDFGQSIRTWSRDVTPIYETEPGKFAPGNFSWWMSNGPSVASTLSMMIPAAGTVKALSLAGKAAGVTANLSKTGKIIGRGVSQAVVSRHIENLLEASGKYDEIYNRNKQLGLTEQEALESASTAASDIYQKNWVMLAQDIPQYLLLGKTFGKASQAVTSGIIKETGESVGKHALKKGGIYFADALGEGGEEAYQYIVAEKADDLAMAKVNPNYRPRELNEFFKEDEFWTSATMGMLGAGVFQAGGRAINKMMGNADEKQRINNIRSYGPTIKYYSEMIKDAETRNDFEAYEEARLGMINTLAGKASEFGNLDILVNSLNDVMSQEATPEALEQFGLSPEDINTIKKDFPTFIQDVQEVGKVFENYSTGKVDGTQYDSDIASELAQLETSKRRLNTRKSDLSNQLESSITKLNEVGFNDLSTIGKDITRINSNLKAHDKVIKYLRKALKNKDLAEETRNYYETSLKEQEKIVVGLRDNRTNLKKSDTYTKEERDSDAKINLDSSLLADVDVTNTKLKYTELALDKKDDAIKHVKDTQKKRNKGEVIIPPEPQSQVEPEAPAEEPVSEATHEVTSTTPESTTTVETKEYIPQPEDVSRRRKLTGNPVKVQEGLRNFGAWTLNEFFEEYDSADAVHGTVNNTGLLKIEGGIPYFYNDNTGAKVDMTQYGNIPNQTSQIVILGKPKEHTAEDPARATEESKDAELTDNEVQAIQTVENTVEHPDSDTDQGAETVKDDTEVEIGETELVYLYNKEKNLVSYLENSDNDISKAVGTLSIDFGNSTIKDNQSLLNALKRGSTDGLTQEMLDEVPIAIALDTTSGTLFVPRPSNVSEGQQSHLRSTRTSIIVALLADKKVTVKGFRKDSGSRFVTTARGSQNNIVEALNLDLKDVVLGVALRGGAVFDKNDNTLGIYGNPNGGNIYLYTDKTPNKEFRGVKLNKAKLSKEHANIILNAFIQSTQKGGFKNQYVGNDVQGTISNGNLLGILVRNGKHTIVTDKVKIAVGDAAFIERLEANQLYRSKNYLHYGKQGKIDLKNAKPEDIDNFVQYAIENFNYAISRNRLSETVPNITIGTTELEEGSDFESMYVKNGWVTTDVVINKYENILEKPQVYLDFRSESKLEIVEPVVEPTKPVEGTPTLDSVLGKYRPFSSKVYEGQRYLRQQAPAQIEQIYELINRDVPVEVTDSLIRVVGETGSHLAFGQVKDGSISLYQNAEEGTGYHESFHIVSLYYLTGAQRSKVYDQASEYYNIDRKDERNIEEALAEDFRKYMLSEKKIAPKQRTIQSFFQRLYDFILDLFVKPESKISDLTIAKLFNTIENGKFKEAKIRNKNLKKYGGYDYLRKIDGFSTEQVHNITNLLMYQMLTKNNVLKLEDVPNLSLDPVVDYLNNLKDDVKAASLNPNVSDELKVEFERLSDVYSKILGSFDKFTDLVKDRLFALNINRQADAFEDTSGIDMHNLFVKESGGKDITKFDRASYESSGKDNLLSNIKLYIATLPASGEIDLYTQMPKMTDFTESYSKLMKDLSSSLTFKDMLKVLEQKAKDDIYYDILLNGSKSGERVGLRNTPDSFKHQFEIAVSKHRHNFTNVVIDAEGNHIFVDAAVSKAERDLSYEWGLNFYLTGKYINIDDTVNKKALSDVRNKFITEVKNPVNKEYARGFKIPSFDKYLTTTVEILNSLGITLSEKDLKNVISIDGKDSKGNENEHIGLHNLVNKTLDSIFGSKGILVSLETGDIGRFDKPEEILARDKKIIEFAKKVITNNIYIIDDTVLGAENNTYYVYAQPSLLTEYTKELKKDTELFRGLRDSVYNTNSQYLQQIEDGKNFGLVTFASYRPDKKQGKDYKKIDDKADFLLKFNSIYKGLIPLPTLADRKAYYFFKGLDRIDLKDSVVKNNKYIISDRVVDIFYKYAQDEQSRIAKVKAEIEEAKDSKNYSKLVLNMHYTKTDSIGTPVLDNSGEGLKYQHFTLFNSKDINKADIRKALDSNILDTIEYIAGLELIQINRDSNNNIKSIVPIGKDLNNDIVKNAVKEFGSYTNAMYHMMAEYTLNTNASVIELEKLVSGDPAYYKSLEDKIKRLNAPVAPGEKIIEEFETGEFKDKTTYESAILKSFKYKDTQFITEMAPKFAEALRLVNPNATDTEVEASVKLRLAPYSDIDVTDAQVYVTPKMYRELKIRMGEWENAQEEAYRVILSNTTDKEQLLKAQTLIMQPLKLVHFGQYFKDNAGIPIYDKMSVAVLLPDVVKGTLLEPLYNKMVSSNIDMIKYDSAVKVGNTGAVDYFDRAGNPIEQNLDFLTTFTQRFKYLRKQQVTDPHVTETRMVGTQVKKVVMQNLKLDKSIYKIKGSNKKYTGDDIAEMFSKAYSTLSDHGRKAVEKGLGIDANNNVNKEKLYNSLREAASQSNQPYNIIDSLYVDEEGNPNVQLDTLLNRNWTESRMISFITKKTVDTVIPGTDLIQMSGGGLITNMDSQLKLLDSKGRTEISVSISLFKTIIPDYTGKTFNEKLAWLKKNWAAGFDGVGYRIPTQGQNSVIPFVVKKFLPENYGNTIILPYGFTALTGSDFDIDKLFIAKYNYYAVGDRLVKYKFYDGDANGNMTNKDTLKEIWKAYVLPKLVRRDNLVALKEKIDKQADKKKALLEAWENELDTGVKVDIAEELGIDTITQDVLDAVGVNMSYEDLNKYIETAMDYPEETPFVEENLGKDAYEVNHRKSVENRLLDLMFSVLTNEEHILETKTPLDTFTEKLREMSVVVKDKKPLGMLAAASPAYQLQVKNWYIGGGKGIGPFALNNVHHALTQIAGYNIDEYDLSGVMGRDNIAIVDWLSALINANVDIAKDPYIFHLNVHEGTYDIVNFLIRAGYGEQTFWLINQEFLKEGLTKDYLIDKAIEEASKGATPAQIELRKKEINDIASEYSNPEVTMSDPNLESYITESNKDYLYYAKQAGMVDAHEALNTAAQKLSAAVLNSRIDNKGFGNTLGALRKFDKGFQAMRESDESFDNLISSTFLDTVYNNSIPFIREIYTGLTLDSTNGFDEIIDHIIPNYGEVDRDTVSAAVYSGIVSLYFNSAKGFNRTKEDVSKLFKGESSIGHRVRSLGITYPDLLENKFIQTLKPVFDRGNNVWFLKYISGDKNDKFTRDSFSEGWGDLLEHSDPYIRKIGEDLIYYSFYTSGFNRSLYSFYQDVPISKLTSRPDHSPKEATQSFDEFVKDMLSELNSFVLSTETRDRISNEAMKYLGSRDIPTYKGNSTPIKSSDGLIGAFKLKEDGLEVLGKNIEGLPIFQNLYTIKHEAVEYTIEYVGYKTDSNEAVFKVIPSSGADYKGHFIYELGYEGSIFSDTTQPISDDVFENTLNTVEGYQDFLYINDKKVMPSTEVEAADLKTTVSESRLASIPENIRSNPEVQNAALNMNEVEFNKIVEQIKKCN